MATAAGPVGHICWTAYPCLSLHVSRGRLYVQLNVALECQPCKFGLATRHTQEKPARLAITSLVGRY